MVFISPDHKAFFLGLIKGNLMVFISPDHKRQFFCGGVYVALGGG